MVRCYFHASLNVRFEPANPVGLVRTEDFLVEHRHADPDIDLRFLMFDLDWHAYRTLRPEEAHPGRAAYPAAVAGSQAGSTGATACAPGAPGPSRPPARTRARARLPARQRPRYLRQPL